MNRLPRGAPQARPEPGGATPMRPKRDRAHVDQSPNDPKLGSFGAAVWRMNLGLRPISPCVCAVRSRAEIGFVRSKSRDSRRVAICRIAKERGEARPPRLIRSAAEGSKFHDSENRRRNFGFSFIRRAGIPRGVAVAVAWRPPPIRGQAVRATESLPATFERDTQHKTALRMTPLSSHKLSCGKRSAFNPIRY